MHTLFYHFKLILRFRPFPESVHGLWYLGYSCGGRSASYPEYVKSTFDGEVSCFPKASKFIQTLVMVSCILRTYYPRRDNSFNPPFICPNVTSFGLYIFALIGLICQVLALILGFIYLCKYDTAVATHVGQIHIEQVVLQCENPGPIFGLITLAEYTLIVAIASAYKIVYSVTFILFLPKTSSACKSIMRVCQASYRCAVEQLNREEKDVIKYGVRALLVVSPVQSYFPAYLFYLIRPGRIIFFMGIIGTICLSFLTYTGPGLVPFCTENYGKLYWMDVDGV
uniref:Uncharacterized protein n=1 Tax=Glossina palpalis gambiensis TaxID=67801 RepID=A0A1B0C0W9_9MUSC